MEVSSHGSATPRLATIESGSEETDSALRPQKSRVGKGVFRRIFLPAEPQCVASVGQLQALGTAEVQDETRAWSQAVGVNNHDNWCLSRTTPGFRSKDAIGLPPFPDESEAGRYNMDDTIVGWRKVSC